MPGCPNCHAIEMKYCSCRASNDDIGYSDSDNNNNTTTTSMDVVEPDDGSGSSGEDDEDDDDDFVFGSEGETGATDDELPQTNSNNNSNPRIAQHLHAGTRRLRRGHMEHPRFRQAAAPGFTT